MPIELRAICALPAFGAAAIAGLLIVGCANAQAGSQSDSDSDSAPTFKLTLGRYASSDGIDALDANLRASLGADTAWIGIYRDRAGLQQWRSGYEHRWDGDTLRTLLSLQSASGGVAVGAISAEVGGDSYAIVGWGRTNLRNYVNLNYDPNDAITFGAGTRAWAGTELSLFQVRDDRLHTGQRVSHAVLRKRFDGEQRLTIDLFTKRGLTNEGEDIRTRSWQIGYDRGALFVRFAHDPHAGFTSPTQNRLSLGARF